MPLREKRECVINRICESCSPDIEALTNFCALPFFEPIIEDETHILFECPLYDEERKQLNKFKDNPMKSTSDLKIALTCATRTREIARFLKKCHNKRFPEEENTSSKNSTEDTSSNLETSSRKKRKRTKKVKK